MERLSFNKTIIFDDKNEDYINIILNDINFPNTCRQRMNK
jgi:hypothetical protein